MAVVADRVIVELEAKLDRYTARVVEAERRFDQGMASIRGSADRTERAVVGAFRNMAGAVGLVSTVALARGLLTLADEAKSLTAQLKLATAQSGSFARAQEDVRRIAGEARAGLTDTARLYGNFQRNARDLGISQLEAARATETVAKTFKISGAGAVEASQGTRQLVQALQSGVLRGDEFNTIMESSPRLARLLAESLGVPIGQLRAMAEEGDLTSDKLVKAFTDKKFTAGIDAEFKALPVTFDEAMEQVRNAAIITFGAFDRGGEFSTALANFILQGTDGFVSLEQAAEQAGIEIRAAFDGLGNAFDPMWEGAKAVFGLIEQEALSLRDSIASLLSSIDQVYNSLRLVKEGEFSLANRAAGGSWWAKAGDPLVPRSNMQGRFLSGYDQGVARGNQRRQDRTLANIMGVPIDEVVGGGRRGRGSLSGGGGSKAKGRARGRTARPKTADELLDEILANISSNDPGYDFYGEGRVFGDVQPNLIEIVNTAGDLQKVVANIDMGQILKDEDAERMRDFAQDFTRDLTDGLADAIVYGDDLGKTLVNVIKRAAAELLASKLLQLFNGGGGGGGGGIAGTLATIGASLFGGGGKASGGHVMGGRMYRVNERPGGVEGFQPAGSGKIIPLGQMNRAQVATEGGGGLQINMPISVTAPGANAQTVELIRQTMQEAAPVIVQTAERVIMKQMGRRRMT